MINGATFSIWRVLGMVWCLLLLAGCKTHVDGAANRSAVEFARQLANAERLVSVYNLKRLAVREISNDHPLFQMREKLTNALIQETQLAVYAPQGSVFKRGQITGRLTSAYDPLRLAVEVRFAGDVRNANTGKIAWSGRVRGRFGPTLVEWLGGMAVFSGWLCLLLMISKSNFFFSFDNAPRKRLRRRLLWIAGTLTFIVAVELVCVWPMLQEGLL